MLMNTSSTTVWYVCVLNRENPVRLEKQAHGICNYCMQQGANFEFFEHFCVSVNCVFCSGRIYIHGIVRSHTLPVVVQHTHTCTACTDACTHTRTHAHTHTRDTPSVSITYRGHASHPSATSKRNMLEFCTGRWLEKSNLVKYSKNSRPILQLALTHWIGPYCLTYHLCEHGAPSGRVESC